MLRSLRALVFCLPCCWFCAAQAAASDTEWRVVLSASDTNISQPQLPDAHSFWNAGLANGGAGAPGFQLRPFSTLIPDSNWFARGSVFTQYAALGVTGAPGPGRSGAESTHVFRSLYHGDSIDAGAQAFGATANDPDAPAGDASQGIWLWDGNRNVEVARVGVDGALGPGLGDGAIYKSLHNVNSQDDIDVRALPNRRVLFAGRIGTSTTLGSDGLSVYVPGQGNHPCMLQGSTDPDLGPGIVAKFSGIGAGMAVSPRGEVYDYASVSAVDGSPPGWYGAQGLWQFCGGAPRLAVLTGENDQYGPGLPDDGNAVFGNDPNGLWGAIAPSLPGSFFFTSGGRKSDGSTFLGLFHHDETLGRNLPILLENAEGTYGPQIAGHVFNTATVPYHVVAAGKYGALQTSISPTGAPTTYIAGMWRVSADDSIEPVAIAGDTDAYAPAAGRTWTGTFYKFTVFDNGDIVTLAQTMDVSDASTATSWWRLRRGMAPVEILKVGDLVQVTTPNGIVSKPVAAINPIYVIGPPPTAGRDVWYTANGNIATSEITIQGYEGTLVLVSGLAARADYLFAGGFD